MSQAGFTPIQLYFSTTAAAAPSAGNLANGELAINITDGKLFYKDNSGSVQVLATKAGASGDVVGPASSTDNALVRFDSTTGKLVQNSAGVLSDTGDLTGIAAITMSGALTLSGGTANGVSFLNASKVLTTGSGFNTDGTNIGVGVGATSGQRVYVRTATDTGTAYLADNGVNTGFVVRFEPSTTLIGNDFNQPLVFLTNNAERMRLDSSGNLLVGTTSVFGSGVSVRPNGTINADSPIANSTFVQRETTGGGSCVDFHRAITTNDPVFVYFGTEASFTVRGSITYNRTAGLTAYNTTSDYRAKDISGPVVDSGTLIDSTPVYMGKMKGATQERPMFIAHEVPAYAHTGEKDAVDADGNPVYQQLDASALIPVMWAEIQSLRARVAALESN
jgi:hypothetical protein